MTVFNRAWRATPRAVRATLVALCRRLLSARDADRTAAALLLGYAALWAVTASIAKAGIALQGDMAEAFALSREFSFGYVNQPPLINWITAAWFAVFPVAPWSFYLLGCLNAALGMGAVWLAARYVVDGRRRVLAVALLGLTPIFTFHAATFNHNIVQLSLWPLVALSFLASIERPKLVFSFLFGLASGLAILAKHYAVLIVFACMLAVLLHPRRNAYLRSPRPYLAAVVCLAVVAPHVHWLMANNFISVREYVAWTHPADPTTALRYVGAFAAYLAPALLVLWLVLPSTTRGTVWAILRGWPPRRRVVACIALVPVILPLLVLPLAGIAPRVAWMYPAFFFAPLAVVAAPELTIGLRTVAAVVGSVAALALAIAVVSPALMIGNFLTAAPERQEPLAALADAATDAWRSRVGRPLTLVGGSQPLVWHVSFYSDDHPLATPSSARVTSDAETVERWQREGVLGACHVNNTGCHRLFTPLQPAPERIELTLPVRFLGIERPPRGYVLFIVRGGRSDPRPQR
jgi:4-amino-4-deoxy-L-arabinose transferase-like glycosyltransferase